jgi:hypothetical protein
MANPYDSDGSTLVGEDRYRKHRPQQERARPRSADNRRTRQSYYGEKSGSQKQGSSKYETLGKVALVLGVLQLIGGIIHMLHEEKSRDKEREHRRQKRRAFERAKEKRRREEEKREMDDEDSEMEFIRPREVRRITNGPARSRSTSSSRSRHEWRIDERPPRADRRSRGDFAAGNRYDRDGRATSRMR